MKRKAELKKIKNKKSKVEGSDESEDSFDKESMNEEDELNDNNDGGDDDTGGVEDDEESMNEEVDEDDDSGDDDAGDVKDDEDDDGDEKDEVEEINEKEVKSLKQEYGFNPVTENKLLLMQISELLDEARLTTVKQTAIDGFLQKLSCLLKEKPKKKIIKLSNLQNNVTNPVDTGEDVLKYQPPKSVYPAGSYALGTSMMSQNIQIDVIVEIPKDCIHSKDFKNEAVLRRRALYVVHVAAILSESELIDKQKIKFTYLGGNFKKPGLIVTPSEIHGNQFEVVLNFAFESGTFKYNRFHVKKNNLRRCWYLEGANPEDLEKDPATPHYNTAILSDLAFEDHHRFISDSLKNAANINDGIILLHLWLLKRHSDKELSSILTSFVVYLLNNKKLNRRMSSFEIFRNTLLQLSQSDWINSGISLSNPDPSDVNQPQLEDFQSCFEVVFIDSTGYVNLCANMSRCDFEMVRHEAKMAIASLLSHSFAFDVFPQLFIHEFTFQRKFDYVFHIKNLGQLKKFSSKTLTMQDRVADFCGNYVAACKEQIVKLLEKAIGNKLKLIAMKPSDRLEWPVDAQPPTVDDSRSCLTFGLKLDHLIANQQPDRGPSADTPEGAEFQKFWGEESNLRRYKDGAICESVVFPCSTLADCRTIVMRIIKYILERHVGISKHAVLFVGPQLDALLHPPMSSKEKKNNSIEYGTGEEQHTAIVSVFDSLAKELRVLNKGLPLAINTVQAICPAFRYSEVFLPPVPAITWQFETGVNGTRMLPLSDKPCPTFFPALDVLCLLEGSGKWPDDKEAVKMLKSAIYIKLAKSLDDEHGLKSLVYPGHLECQKDGYVFRIHIGCMREIQLSKKVILPDGKIKLEDNEESLALERKLVALPILTSTIHGIQQQHSSFSSSVRLVKRWLSAQLLEGYLKPEAIELIVAYLYISLQPYCPPGSPLLGLLQFLHLMSTHDWQMSPLIVNLNNNLTDNDCAEIQTRFSQERSNLPSMVLSTPNDKLSRMWTSTEPSPLILKRLTMLSRASLHVLEKQIMDISDEIDFKQIFRPPLSDFNVLIHLDTAFCARRKLGIDYVRTSKNRPNQEILKSKANNFPVIDFDPAQCYLEDLKDTFGEFAYFFYDTYGGTSIAMVWKPAAFKPKPYDKQLIDYRMLDESRPIADDAFLVPNVDAILKTIKNLGEGIVKSVQVLKAPLQRST